MKTIIGSYPDADQGIESYTFNGYRCTEVQLSDGSTRPGTDRDTRRVFNLLAERRPRGIVHGARRRPGGTA